MNTPENKSRDVDAGAPAADGTTPLSVAQEELTSAPGSTQGSAKTEPAASKPQAFVKPKRKTARPAKTFAAPRNKRPSLRGVVSDIGSLKDAERELVEKLLTEGSTFQDVVEFFNAQGGERITVNGVRTYFQANLQLQTARALRQVEDAEGLLKCLDEDPDSAEARLARATLLTGYAKGERDTASVSPLQAARDRMQRENLNLKRQVLVMQKKKLTQDLKYSKARTDLIMITQVKLQKQVLELENELRLRQLSGQPIGEDMLEKIKALYGIVSTPLLYEDEVNAQLQVQFGLQSQIEE